jgi:hypothetical protein
LFLHSQGVVDRKLAYVDKYLIMIDIHKVDQEEEEIAVLYKFNSSWTLISCKTMQGENIPRSKFSLISYEDRIFMVGGCSYNEVGHPCMKTSIEVARIYSSDKWKSLCNASKDVIALHSPRTDPLLYI